MNEHYSLTFEKGRAMMFVRKEVRYAYYERTRGT